MHGQTNFPTGRRVTIATAVPELGTVARWTREMGPREATPHHTPVRFDGSAATLMVPSGLLAAV